MSIPSQVHVQKQALYFGCIGRPGHYLHNKNGSCTLYPEEYYPTLPWNIGLLDADLLKNGEHQDFYDGKVFWTAGGNVEFWYAFFWWDNSIDKRGGSNSGFYVRGFDWPLIQEAFNYACLEWPEVVSRQKFPLILQDPHPPNFGIKNNDR